MIVLLILGGIVVLSLIWLAWMSHALKHAPRPPEGEMW
jgi:hypothetical protein